jgi:ribose 5-phosphate isomerase B
MVDHAAAPLFETVGSPRSCKTDPMRVYLGTDHAGFELKNHLLNWLREQGHEAVDCGATTYDPEDDYPTFVLRAAESVAGDPDSLGIVIGGSGNGEAIAANKVCGIRAALVGSDDTALWARQHNDANVISLGARTCSIEEATRFVKLFLDTPYSNAPRHARRIAMITEYERSRTLPPMPSS